MIAGRRSSLWPMPRPRSVEWSKLSPRSLEIVAQIVTRQSASYGLEEIAEQIDASRDGHGNVPSIRHLKLSKGAITKGWIAARTKELRQEIEETGAATR